jgi:hypothetical protein
MTDQRVGVGGGGDTCIHVGTAKISSQCDQPITPDTNNISAMSINNAWGGGGKRLG